LQCRQCGCEFEPTHGLQRYCSRQCRDKHSGRNTYQSNTIKVCQVCGKEFVAIKGSEKFCSQNCKQKHRNERSRAKYIHITYVNTCQECGTEFVARRRKQYCSDECRKQHEERCKEARREEQKRERKRLAEKRKAERIAQREANYTWYSGICAVCGKPFKTLNPAQKTCSSECGKRYAYARKQKRIPKEQIVDKDITLEAVYRRDSGVCYLCGGLCDWADRDKERNTCGKNYPSIDHLIPVAKGGRHAWANVRLAHLGCNIAKADLLIEGIEELIPKCAVETKASYEHGKKKVTQYTKDGVAVASYDSTAEAERMTGVKQRGIQNCARGEKKSYNGYVWRYGGM